MDPTRLPSECEQIEHLLGCAPRPEPSAALRWRVLADVHDELRHCVLHRLRVELRREQKRAGRRLALGCAAALLMAVGLAIGVMHAAGVPLNPPASAPSVADVAWQLQQLSPEMSQKDSLLQATLRQIGPNAGCEDLLKNIFPDTKSQKRTEEVVKRAPK
jgi:hypothetical protein